MFSPLIDRRRFAAILAGTAIASAPPRRGLMTLGFSTYGMPSWTTERALDTVAAVGFDSYELCILPTYDSQPTKLTPSRRRALRRRAIDRGLTLTALMESLTPSADDKADTGSRERLQRAAELARDLGGESPPLVETVLGGGEWDKIRGLYRDRLGKWVESLDGITLAIKPHRFGAMSLPVHAIWLIEQVGSTRLKMVYDQSHYEHRGQDQETLVKKAAPHVAFVAVKDVEMKDGKATFQLPGESRAPNHVSVLRGLAKYGYKGDVSCEVSGMVFSRPSYDGLAAARVCREKMERFMREAGVR